MTDQTPDPSRRRFVRHATAGAALVWAAPGVTAISRALGAEGSAPPNEPGPCPGGTLYRWKYDASQQAGVPGCWETGELNYSPAGVCDPPAGVGSASDVQLGGYVDGCATSASIPGQGSIDVVEYVDPTTGKWSVRFTLPAGCRVGDVTAKAGLGCITDVQQIDGRTFAVVGVGFDVSNVSVVVCCVPA